MEINEESIPEPILRLRKPAACAATVMLRTYDHSGEGDAARARKRSKAHDGDARGGAPVLCREANDGAAAAGGAREDPPARERPADDNWPHRDSLSFTRSLIFYGSGSVTPEHATAAKHVEEARALRKKYFRGRGVRCSLAAHAPAAATATATVDETSAKAGAEGMAAAAANGETGDDRKKASAGPNPEEPLPDATKQPSSEGTAPPPRLEYVFGNDGVVEVYDATDFRRTDNLVAVPSLASFVADYRRLVEIASSGAMRSFSFQRLQMLTSAFKMHVTINGSAEDEAQSGLLGTDFYGTMKVDNHIHSAAAATAKQFVGFVRDKLAHEGDTVVTDDGQTLRQVFARAGLDSEHLTIDAFNVLADHSVYQRFDNFNGKYSPFRMAQMRKIFLKTDNRIDGRYFAELTKIVLARHEQSKGHNSAAEMRLSIYGMKRDEWEKLARWVLTHGVLSTHNRWLIQVPRLWRVYCGNAPTGTASFQHMLEHLFAPLFEATLHPARHPEVTELLRHVVGFDSVDDEGSLEAPLSCCRPALWKTGENPAYCWQLYYLWANIEVLNRVRAARGLNTFAFRPHAGETGDTLHLAATYMLCGSINHGVNLDKQVSLQYLYYLDQVGLSMSPLSNNFLFRKMRQNPFPKLFKRGLNVTLSTDDPLLFHMSDDALLEEYSVARASFELSMTDISEIARNSVYQSGFENHLKEQWLGRHYKKGVTHCDEKKTHVPLIRAKFRAEHLALEHSMVILLAAGKGDNVLREMMHQFGDARNGQRDILFSNMTKVPDFPEQNQL